jgi:hypothetical protein
MDKKITTEFVSEIRFYSCILRVTPPLAAYSVVKFLSLVIVHIRNFRLISLLEVCRASRIKPKKIADQAIFYPANSVEPKVRSMPDNRDFYVADGAKIPGGKLYHQICPVLYPHRRMRRRGPGADRHNKRHAGPAYKGVNAAPL